MGSSRWTLEGRNYVVTGGTKGIGYAVVEALLERGAGLVVTCSRSGGDEVDQVVASLRSRYPPASRVVHVPCDVATEEGRRALLDAVAQACSSSSSDGLPLLHGLVNNVGLNFRKPVLDQTDKEYHRIMRTNVDTAYFVSKMFHQMLRAGAADSSGGGSSEATIVNVSSAAGVQSSGTGAAYGMSKAAINQLTRSLACEWAGLGIRYVRE